tara:strand:+ start:212 stop:748 length:537 start_codon:yes stop_codon:yes gene_type:complete
MFKPFKASDKLLPYVLMHYTINWTNINNKISELCLPSGTCFIVFQLKGNCSIKFKNTQLTLPQFYVVGQQTASYYIESCDKDISLMGVILKPTALFHLFNSINLQSLTNNVLPLKSVFGNHLVTFNEEFLTCDSIEHRIKLIEKLLLDCIETRQIKHTIIDYAVELINQKKAVLLLKI